MPNGKEETVQADNKDHASAEGSDEEAEEDEKGDAKESESDCERENSRTSESEAEDADASHELIVDEDLLKEIVILLVKKTKGYTVSALEKLHSDLTEIIWTERFVWDRTRTAVKVKEYITGI